MKLPFEIDRAAGKSLGEQMFQGLKKAIARGVYGPGDRLPGIREMAASAGVSEKVSRRALARLAEIGWSVSRQGSNSVVADRGKNRRGRVLFFCSGTGLDYHSSWLVSALRLHLLKANYRLSAVSAYDQRKDGESRMLVETLKEHWDLVIEFGMMPGTRAAIEDAGWPFVILGNGRPCVPSAAASCLGKIELRNGKAVSEFVRACVRKGIRSVVQFLYAEGGFDATGMLAMPGIACETVRIPICRHQLNMYTRAYAAMSARLRDASKPLPDVFLFTDDHLAQGGLMALMERGVRIPEDVRVVTHANRGFGPFWIKPLTRLEMDPMSQGTAVARAVLAYFSTGRLPQDIVLGSVWKSGLTF